MPCESEHSCSEQSQESLGRSRAQGQFWEYEQTQRAPGAVAIARAIFEARVPTTGTKQTGKLQDTERRRSPRRNRYLVYSAPSVTDTAAARPPLAQELDLKSVPELWDGYESWDGACALLLSSQCHDRTLPTSGACRRQIPQFERLASAFSG